MGVELPSVMYLWGFLVYLRLASTHKILTVNYLMFDDKV